MGGFIATKLHVADELLPGVGLINDMRVAHNYVIDSDVVDLLKREDARHSIRAMVQAGIARLPLNPLLVEYKLQPHGNMHWMVLLTEKSNMGGTIEARVICLMHKEGVALLHDAPISLAIELEGVAAKGASDSLYAAAAVLGVSFAFLMLNIKGLDKKVIDPSILNRVRHKKGKTSIPTHRVVHIASVYDRNGNIVGDGDSVKHRRVRVHLRRGHVRNQACGPEMADRKMVYIEPVLVNFRDGSGSILHPTKQVIRV